MLQLRDSIAAGRLKAYNKGMNVKSLMALWVTALLLTGCTSGWCLIWCHNETSIQNGYVASRNTCQDDAQKRVRASSGNVRNYNAALLEAFAGCMKRKGWGVTSPKKTNSTKGGPNDTSTLSGDPWAPTPYGIQQQQAARTAQQPQGYPQPQAIQQPYGYAPQQGYPPPQQQYQQQIRAPQQYQQVPQQQQYQQQIPQQNYQQPQPYNQGYRPPAGQQQRPQNYGYSPAPQPKPQPQYSYPAAPAAQPPAYRGARNSGYGYGGSELGPENSNRAGIGLAPGF